MSRSVVARDTAWARSVSVRVTRYSTATEASITTGPARRLSRGLTWIIRERLRERRTGPVAGGGPHATGSVTRSPERSSTSCGRDEGVPLRRPRGDRPRRHPSEPRLLVHE